MMIHLEKLSKYCYLLVLFGSCFLAMYRRDTAVASFRLLSVCPVDPLPRTAAVTKV